MVLPLVMFPILIGFIVQGAVAVSRLNKFLLSDEIDSNAVLPNPLGKESVIVEGTCRNFRFCCYQSTNITKDGSFAWTKSDDDRFKEVLKKIHLSFGNELVAIIGEVGAGKSSLLSALLGEMHKVRYLHPHHNFFSLFLYTSR